MNANAPVLDAISERVIGRGFKVSNSLGSDFPQKSYNNALTIELRDSDLAIVQQVGIMVADRGAIVAE